MRRRYPTLSGRPRACSFGAASVPFCLSEIIVARQIANTITNINHNNNNIKKMVDALGGERDTHDHRERMCVPFTALPGILSRHLEHYAKPFCPKLLGGRARITDQTKNSAVELKALFKQLGSMKSGYQENVPLHERILPFMHGVEEVG